jgi:hypothetical protein
VSQKLPYLITVLNQTNLILTDYIFKRRGFKNIFVLLEYIKVG